MDIDNSILVLPVSKLQLVLRHATHLDHLNKQHKIGSV
jgi:hypothetical protein